MRLTHCNEEYTTATRPEPRKRNSNDVLPPRRPHAPTIAHKNQEPKTTHNNEKIAPVLLLAGGFAIFNMFR